jgi:hypothetical protein
MCIVKTLDLQGCASLEDRLIADDLEIPMTWIETALVNKRARVKSRSSRCKDAMYECEIALDSCAVTFKSNSDLTAIFRELSRRPQFAGLSVNSNSGTAKHVIRYVSGGKSKISYSRHGATIRGQWSTLRDGETLIYAAFPFFELQRQSAGYASMHAGAVAFPEGAVLLLGKEGAGKTSTAMALARLHGAKLIGNDYVILGMDQTSSEIIVRGGRKSLHLRYESVRRSMPELLPFFSHGDLDDGWLRRALVQPHNLNVLIEKQPQSVRSVYIVHVDELQKDVFEGPADNLLNRVYLNENLSRHIRGSCILLLKENRSTLGFVPSLDTQVLFDRRAKLIDRLFGELKMTYISGPAHKIAEVITAKLGQK